jgi:ubiquinone/menaquinone biosynthesis C-methylase UbiE
MSEWALHDPQILEIGRATGMGHESAVLDVGCNTGALLTLLARTFEPARCVGVDANAAALEVGRQLFGDVVTLTAGDSTALPFEDEEFSHVLCMNALSLMPHRAALAEMVRVARPGSALVLSAETFSALMHALTFRGARATARTLRDVPLTLVVALTGRQPRFSPIWGRRAFVSVRRLRRMLEELGCEVVSVEPRARGATWLRRATQVLIVARTPSGRPWVSSGRAPAAARR